MKIRGVFSMSIINRLKSLFKGEQDMEERNIANKRDVEEKSSNFDNTIVSGTKTSVPISDVVKTEEPEVVSEEVAPEEEVKPIEEESVEEDLPIIEEDEPSTEEEPEAEEEVPEAEEEVPEAEEEEPEVEEEAEVEEVQEEGASSNEEDDGTDDEEELAEKADDEKENKEEKRDNMTLLTDKELLTDANRDPEFTAEFIDAGIETVKHCFQCGTCGGGCPSGRRTPYKVRQIVRKCLLGLKEEVITDDALWMCTTCYTCQERCPRSVKIVEIIKKARNVAAHAGYMAKPHKMTGVFVMNTGHGVPINDATKALRTKIGLSEVPATTHADAGALEEVQKLCKITAFDELIGYDEATGGLKE